MGALSGDIAIAWQNQFSQLEHAVDLEPDNMFSKGSKDFPIWDIMEVQDPRMQI
jgi:hypothetical protein